MTRPEPRALFVDGLYALDAHETRRRLALALAAVRAASIEAGGDGALDGTRHRIEALLLGTARRAVEDLAAALAEHEAKRVPPPPTGIRLPRLPLTQPPRTA